MRREIDMHMERRRQQHEELRLGQERDRAGASVHLEEDGGEGEEAGLGTGVQTA